MLAQDIHSTSKATIVDAEQLTLLDAVLARDIDEGNIAGAVVARIVDASAVARIDSTLARFVDSGTIAGVSALIFERGEEVYFNAFGLSDREAGIPMARNTIVQIFSMTKPITGVALMTLFDEGAFQLDDAVRLRPPATPEENNGVVGEFFWDGAASTLFWIDPVNELTAVLFVQLRPFDGVGLHKSFRDAVYGHYKN